MPSGQQDDEIDRLGAAFNTMLAALERSREAQRQLVADASHELRTPLTSIRTNIELLGRAKDLPEAERAEVVAAASAQLEELTLLVGDLIDLARDGRPAADEVEDVRLDELVRESAARVNGGRVRVDAEPTLVRGSRTRLARAVSNLLDNAVKYSPAESAVEVTVRGGEVAVRDHGPGIAPRTCRTCSIASTGRRRHAGRRARASAWRSCARSPRRTRAARSPRPPRAVERACGCACPCS